MKYPVCNFTDSGSGVSAWHGYSASWFEARQPSYRTWWAYQGIYYQFGTQEEFLNLWCWWFCVFYTYIYRTPYACMGLLLYRWLWSGDAFWQFGSLWQLTDFGLSKVGLINSTDDLSGPTVGGATIMEDITKHHKVLSGEQPQQRERRQQRSAVGTPDYLAPEILLGNAHGNIWIGVYKRYLNVVLKLLWDAVVPIPMSKQALLFIICYLQGALCLHIFSSL